MANFVLYVDEVAVEQFEKINIIQSASKDTVKWRPEGSSNFSVTTGAFMSAEIIKPGYTPPMLPSGVPVPNAPKVRGYKNLRLEFSQNGIDHIDAVLKVLKGEEHHQEATKAG